MLQGPVHEAERRWAPMMDIGNFDRRLFSSRQFVVKVIEITPEFAKELLERAGIVHNQSKARIEQYAATMVANDWRLTHQGLAFNWDGKLVDGYLRLQAIVKSNKTIAVPVAFGLDPKDYPAIDTGYARKAKHLLRLSGISASLSMSASQGIGLLVRYLEAMKEGKMPKSSRFSPQNILAFHLQHPIFLDVAEEVMGLKQTWREVMSPGVATALAYMAIKKGHPQDVVLEFIKSIGNFAGQDERHPILVLYKTLRKDKDGQKMVKPEESLVKAIRAYNKWVRKGKMSRINGIGLQADDETDTDELPLERAHFPVIVEYRAHSHRDVNTLN